jgi:catechol 2,3-dioxygenase-like lactoylglutathione lyase family enzyme
VSDPARSQRFYQEALGFRYAHALEVAGEPTDTLLRLKDVELRAIYMERDGTVIELLHFVSPGSTGDPELPRPLNRHGLTHLSFQVDDMEGVLAGIEQLGGRVLDDTRIRPSADTAAILCTDPDGTLIELVQRASG